MLCPHCTFTFICTFRIFWGIIFSFRLNVIYLFIYAIFRFKMSKKDILPLSLTSIVWLCHLLQKHCKKEQNLNQFWEENFRINNMYTHKHTGRQSSEAALINLNFIYLFVGIFPLPFSSCFKWDFIHLITCMYVFYFLLVSCW